MSAPPGPERGLEALAGVGPVRAARLARQGLETIEDLLFLVPRRLEVRGERATVAEALAAVGRDVHVRGTLDSPSIFRAGRGRTVLGTRLRDASGAIRVLFFNQPWLREPLRELAREAAPVELSGRVAATRSGPALSAPRLGTQARPLPPPGSLLPVYPAGEGVGQDLLRGLLEQALALAEGRLEEPLPAELLRAEGLPELAGAVRELHAPTCTASWEAARRRVSLEGLLPLAARLRARRAGQRAAGRALVVEPGAADRRLLLERSPFAPTTAQRRALEEILSDLARQRPMRRLLQGDVGSGKTWVALAAAAAAVRAGGQVAFLAPTELLAEQHHLGARPLLASLGVAGHLLTGSTPRAERKALLARLARGEPGLVFGTHALFSADVRFARLALAIVDEQQRFGVAHKRALLEKGEDVHVLLATATPIPRTLALALYGDLDVTLLDEAPPGRGELRTRRVGPEERDDAEAFVARRLEAGERAFWVCPSIDADEGEGPSALEVHGRLARGPLGRHGVELVHGRVPAEERAARVERFRDGRSRLLVGTTVIEVGIDVPAATVCAIEGAERFGLAQLHQLRGRVGRGGADAWCLLLVDQESPAAAARLSYFSGTRDGFAIAEEDLRLRGMGELSGLRQAGFAAGPEGGLEDDLDLLFLAQRALERDPGLLVRYLGGRPADLV